MRNKILIWDIETAPILAQVWDLWQQTNVGLNQIERDWFIMAWGAKWLDDSKIMYMDQRNSKKIEDDKKILKTLWNLLDEADVVITQNGKDFDEKKVNARFIIHGMNPPSPYQHIDTKVMAKKRFRFTSNKLEYLSAKLCPESKKGTHVLYPGHELWRACLANEPRAWREMEKYCKQDVLSTEAVYKRLAPWGLGSVDLNTMHDDHDYICSCGSKSYIKQGFFYSKNGKHQRFQCVICGAWFLGKQNLLSQEKRRSLLK